MNYFTQLVGWNITHPVLCCLVNNFFLGLVKIKKARVLWSSNMPVE